MSHFCGLVISTPKYAATHDVEDAIAKYDENLEVPEYSSGKVSDYKKVEFIEYYAKERIKKNVKEMLYNNLVKDGKIEASESTVDEGEKKSLYYNTAIQHQDEYVELFKKNYPKLFEEFEELYDKHGQDWNDNAWRVNYATGEWEVYSSYNPSSKWDWYTFGGRWHESIKTKSGEYVNECLLGEIDWTDFKPEDYEEKEEEDWLGNKYKPLKESVKWHFTKSNTPFCLVIDGNWVEKGEMGWWGMTSNEMSDEDWHKQFFEIMSKLPEDSEVQLVDFHI